MLDSVCNMARQNDKTEQQQVSQRSLVTAQATASSCCADRLGAKISHFPLSTGEGERQTYSRLAHDREEKESRQRVHFGCARALCFSGLSRWQTSFPSVSLPGWRQTRREMSKLTQATLWRAGKNRKSVPGKHHRKVLMLGGGEFRGWVWILLTHFRQSSLHGFVV